MHMTILSLIKRMPSYADEVKIGISEAIGVNIKGISTAQFYGIALTAGYILGNEQMLNDIRSEAKMHLQEQHSDACKTAAVIMSARSAYHVFRRREHTGAKVVAVDEVMLDTAERFKVNDVKVPEMDFAVYCLTAAILLCCNACSNYYTDFLIQRGVPIESLDKIVCFISFLRAAAAALEIESMRSYDFILREESF